MPKSKLSFFLAALAAIGMSLTLAAAPASAQQKPANIARVYFATAKPGMSAEYEAGRKRHAAAHKSMGDTWTWHAFQVETGANTGSYQYATLDHQWADFDTWDKKHLDTDSADAAKNLDPYSASGSNSFFVYLRDVSSPGGPPPTPAPLTQLIHFDVKTGGDQEFGNAIKKIHEAIQKTKWGSAGQTANYHWFMLVNGGNGPHFVLVLPMKGWADMEEPETPFPVMLEKAFGRTDAAAVMQTFDRTIARQYSETLRYRPDLSYVPGR